jgi:hypothetical protein
VYYFKNYRRVLMIKIIMAVAFTFFMGCSSQSKEILDVEPNLIVGKSVIPLEINDQFEKVHTITADTKKIIFAFSKDAAHTCNDYFETKDADYLAKNSAAFIADVSAAPSLIRNMFIMPGLKDLKHTVLILTDESVAAPFRAGVDTEKIIAVTLSSGKVMSINAINTVEELTAFIEKK